MSIPWISVVIDAFNHGEYIEEAVDSVLSQDFPRERYEVVHDGSTDDTPKRMQKYGERA